MVFRGRQRITPDMLIEQDTDISGVVSFPEYEETLRRNHDVVKKLALDTEFQVWSVENQKKALCDAAADDDLRCDGLSEGV